MDKTTSYTQFPIKTCFIFNTPIKDSKGNIIGTFGIEQEQIEYAVIFPSSLTPTKSTE